MPKITITLCSKYEFGYSLNLCMIVINFALISHILILFQICYLCNIFLKGNFENNKILNELR